MKLMNLIKVVNVDLIQIDQKYKQPLVNNYNLKWNSVDEKELIDLLIKRHDFGEERVRTKIEKLKEVQKEMAQKGLKSFFG